MKRLIFGALLLASFGAISDMRELQTGNDLLYNIQQARKGDVSAALYISGYLRGITDFQTLTGSLCPPDGVDMDQYRDIVESYLVKNPKDRNEAAIIHAAIAAHQAFPCKKKP